MMQYSYCTIMYIAQLQKAAGTILFCPLYDNMIPSWCCKLPYAFLSKSKEYDRWSLLLPVITQASYHSATFITNIYALPPTHTSQPMQQRSMPVVGCWLLRYLLQYTVHEGATQRYLSLNWDSEAPPTPTTAPPRTNSNQQQHSKSCSSLPTP